MSSLNLKFDSNNVVNIHKSESVNVEEELADLTKKYADVFSPELGTMADIVVDIELEENASPIYVKARTVPYALKTKVEDKLEKLVKLGTI